MNIVAKKRAAGAAAHRRASREEDAVLRQSLIEMREMLVGSIERQKPPEVEGGDSGDAADQAGRSIEAELACGVSENERMILEQIEAALRKMDKGLYGTCEYCRKRIGGRRLKTLPFARYCIGCQRGSESARDASKDIPQDFGSVPESPSGEAN